MEGKGGLAALRQGDVRVEAHHPLWNSNNWSSVIKIHHATFITVTLEFSQLNLSVTAALRMRIQIQIILPEPDRPLIWIENFHKNEENQKCAHKMVTIVSFFYFFVSALLVLHMYIHFSRGDENLSLQKWGWGFIFWWKTSLLYHKLYL